MIRPMMWIICIPLVFAGSLRAETPPASSPPVGTPSAKEALSQKTFAPSVEEILPPIYYLEDAQGNLQPAFGFTLEDFRQAYNLIHGLDPESRCPDYVLKKVSVSGEASEHYASLTIACEMLLQRDGMIRIPLSLGQAVITGEPEYNGEEIPLLVYEKTTAGYVAWIKGKANQQRRLVLKTLVPLTVIGGKTALRLRIPSATESELDLTVPMPGAVAEASEGPMLKVAPADNESKTNLKVQGPRGDFELSWHKPDIQAATTPTVLEAAGEILARIDNHGIHTQATLRVRGHGKPFDRFRIRLPIESEVVPSEGTGQSVVAVDDAASSTKKGPVVEVRLREKTLGPVNVRLAARRALDTSMFGKWIELTGFEVLGAARQSGYLAVEVADDLDLLWNPRLGVQQDENLPVSLVHENLVAGFRYVSQPCSLLARIAPRQTRVSVEPRYLVLVGVEQVQLETTLDYMVRGKKARVFDVDLCEWQFDEIGPDNVVAVDRVIQSESGTLSIPLRQPSSGKIELTIRAHRRAESKDKTLRLTFPQTKVTSPGPAAVVIVPEDRVQLTVDSEATKGLARQQVAPPIPLPNRQQSPLFYRGDSSKAVFVAKCDVHARQIAVSSSTTVFLDRQAGRVVQRLSYRIDYEPVDVLSFELPQELRDAIEKVEFRVQGKRVTPIDTSSIAQGEQVDEEGPESVHLNLEMPSIGACDVEIEYPLDSHQMVPQSSLQRSIPLVMPTEGKLLGNRLSIVAESDLRVTMLEGPWKKQTGVMQPAERSMNADQRLLGFVADGRVDRADLGLCLEARAAAQSTVVQRALVQTWLLARHVRQDRAVFRLNTHKKDLRVIFPQGTIMEKTAVYVNGKPVETYPADEMTLRFDLPRLSTSGEWLVEVHSHGTDSETIRGHRRLELPRLGNDTWIRRLYWQLTLPKNEHVINTPWGLVREFRWGWNGLFWQRNPLLKTADLEAWTGTRENPQLASGNDSYLFSGFGRSDSFELVIVSRSWIVLGASGAALVLGLLLIYVPASRHPRTLFVLALALGCAGLLYPESTLLVLQAASLGLVLTLVAGLLERGVRRRRRGLITLDASGSMIGRDSTQTQFLAAGSPPGNSTATSLHEGSASHKGSSVIDGSNVKQ